MTWVYETNTDNTARYILGQPGTRPLVCFGINPSTATPETLDPTIRRVKRFAQDKGYDGWIMLNLYPQRATDPKHIHTEIIETLHQENLAQIKWVMQVYQPTLWAAWGTLLTTRPYFKTCLAAINDLALETGCTWVTIGDTTKEGHPRHPLYLKADAKMREFHMSGYLDK